MLTHFHQITERKCCLAQMQTSACLTLCTLVCPEVISDVDTIVLVFFEGTASSPAADVHMEIHFICVCTYKSRIQPTESWNKTSP